MHILGYFVDENNEKINLILQQLKEARKKRFLELVEYVEKYFNLKINKEDVENIIEQVNIPGKPHLAELLIKNNYVSSVREAFDKYLEEAKTKTSNRAPADLVIEAIKDAGGIAILAHPKKVEKKYALNFEDIMPRLLELGIDGIEVFNSLHSYDDSIRYLNYANKNNLIKTGGSDYHGEQVKPDVKIGVLYNSDENVKIDIKQINLLQ
jgi:predicted metal-dependent phosphoesterase TrpH